MDGLKKGMDALDEGDSSKTGGTIVFLTDGDCTEPVDYDNFETLKQKNIRVVPIAFG